MNTRDFVSQHDIRATVKPADHNPNMNGEEWATSANHWLVTLRLEKRSMRVPFSTGAALSEPDAADVLDSLASDALGVEYSRDFEDWCTEYGYDTDSRRAHRTYALCIRQGAKLQHLLGIDLYHELLEDTERL
jgi:hypothetical protein